ncbi:MAG: ABC transporter ATP-binding protein [Clostridiales bacterium]|nr:ABC transporter ATP-binding protein [Clostridiales bacterium]
MLEVRKVSKTYQHKPILRDVSFTLGPGQSLGVAGHNGSGKSTLLSIVAQVLPPDEGEILVDGAPLRRGRGKAGVLFGYVPQENSLLEDLTVRETLAFWQKVYGLPAAGLFSPSSVPVMLGLDQIRKKRVARLSGGMQKRVSIAIALLRQPRFLLLDEALTALDRGYRMALENYLAAFLSQGNSILYSSHEIGELVGFCSHILVLRRGETAFHGEAGAFPAEGDNTTELDALLNP